MKKIAAFLCSIVMLMSVSFAEFDTEKLDLFRQMIQSRYYKEISDEELMEGAIRGMFNALDQYSAYYNKEESEAFNESVSGQYVGIGIKMENLNNYVHIIKVFKNSPAATAGLRSQDYIIGINGEDIAGWHINKAASYIRGEAGTDVTLKILRDAETFDVTLKRTSVQVESCEFNLLDGDIGYIKIEEFNSDTYNEFNNYYTVLNIIGIKKLIIDLRDNPGGYVSQCVMIGNLVVPRGNITTLKYRNEDEETAYRSFCDDVKMDKIVVLVNENTASASEILAGAMKDTGSGIIVGRQTYGKGVVQEVYNLVGGGSVKITTAEYVTPNGTHIDGIGITPDFIVEDVEGFDEPLTKAREILTSGNITR